MKNALSPYVRQSSPFSLYERSLPSMRERNEEEGAHLRDYWQVVRKRWGLVVTLFVVTVGSTALFLSTMTPTYMAETTLLIEPQTPHVLNIREVLSQPLGPEEYDYYKTQYEILRSQTLASRVIRELQLEQHKSFIEKKELAAVEQGSHVSSGGGEASGPFGVHPVVLGRYLDRLEIRPVTGTRLAKVVFSSPDPVLAAQVVNTHAATYIRQGMELRTRANEQASRFLEEKLRDVKKRIEQSEAALNAYRREQQIISLDEKENIVVDRLVDLNKRLTEAEAEKVALEAQVQFVRTGSYEYVPLVATNSLVQSLKEHVTRLRAEYAALAAEFKPGYPRLDQVKAQVAEAQQRMTQEVTKIGKGLDTAYRIALTKEEELRRRVEEQKEAALKLKDASVTYSILAREVETNRQLYDSVLQRLAEMGVATQMQTSNTSVIDLAIPPRKPAKPKKSLALLLSMVVGTVGGVGTAFFFAYVDNTLKTPSDVERHLRLPTLAMVPDFAKAMLLSRSILSSVPLPSGGSVLSTTMFPLSPRPPFVALEAYRKLRTALLLSRPEEPPQTILFTSATSGEGKTVTAVNTAMALGQMGARVLLVDADLRHPRCHMIIHSDNDIGLTEFLIGQMELATVIKPTVTEHLFFLASGSLPPSPADLLGSKKMRAAVTFLRSFYDYIVIDAPPVLPVSDAEILASMVKGVVLVIDSEQTAYLKVKEAQARLAYSQAEILGAVLNKVHLQHEDYTRYYQEHLAYRQHPEVRETEVRNRRSSGARTFFTSFFRGKEG
ncbi:MAG: GumC family protein [Candidatus Binatia bacterium]